MLAYSWFFSSNDKHFGHNSNRENRKAIQPCFPTWLISIGFLLLLQVGCIKHGISQKNFHAVCNTPTGLCPTNRGILIDSISVDSHQKRKKNQHGAL